MVRSVGFTAVLVLSGCEDILVGEEEQGAITCGREPPLTYENFGQSLLERHCLSCHSVYVRENLRGHAPLGIDFNSWDDVMFYAPRIMARAVEEDTMPPTGIMTPDERDQLGEWLYCEVFPAAAAAGGGGE